MEPTTNALDLARLAADLNLLLDRVLGLTVAVALAGGTLLVAILLLFIRLGALEHRVGERVDASGDRIIRKVGDRISDIDLQPTQEQPAQASPHSTRPRSRRRV